MRNSMNSECEMRNLINAECEMRSAEFQNPDSIGSPHPDPLLAGRGEGEEFLTWPGCSSHEERKLSSSGNSIGVPISRCAVIFLLSPLNGERNEVRGRQKRQKAECRRKKENALRRFLFLQTPCTNPSTLFFKRPALSRDCVIPIFPDTRTR